MSRQAALTLLKERLGLDPESLGPAAIDSALARRSRALHVTDPAAYVTRLAGDPEEWQALVNEIIVPETWFFRGGDLFFYLAHHIQALLRRQPERPVRILSAACSTGEEPYSLAIALTESGLPPARWRIDALDVSTRSLEAARRGLYGAFSFREMDRELQRRYFQPAGEGWQIAGSLRGAVHFQAGNLARPLLLAAAEPYDLVFCRNMLIYLLPAARQQALANLDRLLAADGLLCIGHADSLGELERRFTRFGPARYFLHRRATVPPAAPTPRPGPARLKASAVPASGGRKPPVGRNRGLTPPARQESPADSPPDMLTRARQLGDAGRLAEALDCCQAHLDAHGPSAACLSLMGVLHQARQEHADAVRCLLGALYLQPDHAEALTHLMLLRRLQGRHRDADLLQRRLQRARPGDDS